MDLIHTSGWLEFERVRVLGWGGSRRSGLEQENSKGLTMKKVLTTALVAAVFSTTAAYAADLKMPVKALPAPVEVSPWDVAFGAWVASDYNFRGVTQSAHQPAVGTYFEPRYNINKDLQLYVGMGGASIDFPNHAAAE